MSKQKRTPKGKKLTVKELRNRVNQLFRRFPKKRYNVKQVKIKIKAENSKDSIQYAIDNLVKEAALLELRDGKYCLNKAAITKDSLETIGKVDMIRSGSAYIISDELDSDIFVPARKLNSALDGDKVKVTYFRSKKDKLEGEVVEVVERNSEYFIGTLHVSNRFGFVIPDKLNMFMDIFIPLEQIGEAKDGEKVVVKVVKWPSKSVKSPIGKITDNLGKAGSSDIEMKSILIQAGFELQFPEEVIKETEALSTVISKSEIKRRRDFREVTTFTIDPATAKDFDDALSLQYLENGNCEIGIHIADVAHYVKEGTALDKEALKRATSVYLVDRVLPMLPEKISNELCSLRPNEDKLTFSAVFTFDKNNKIVEEWFGRTIIHSDRRFTYEEAQEVLDTGEGDYVEELKKMEKVAQALRKKKFKNGAINFDSPEVKFKLDEDGTPLSVYVKERIETNMLIEDFMLLANRNVAAYIGDRENEREIPFVYRIHDEPDPTKIADFVKFAQAMKYPLQMDTPDQVAASFNKLVKEAKTRQELRLLEPLAIRTMSKAVYSPNNIGHYGLAFPFYTHFTSPIRRYSDVLVHRIFFKNLKETYRTDKSILETTCKYISGQERKAMDAERQSTKYKQVEYMTKHVGEVFDGVVSGFLERGMFVELKDNYCEGLVAFDSMNESFTVGDGRLYADGNRTGRRIKMGDTVTVRILSANLVKRNIDMEEFYGDEA